MFILIRKRGQMKKVLACLCVTILLSGCYLIDENMMFTLTQISVSENETVAYTETNIPTTPTETNTVTPEIVKTQTETIQPTENPTDTPIPQITATPYPISIQSGTPVYIQNFAYPSSGCDWLGVAGQVFDENGKPMVNQVVMISGDIEAEEVEIIGVTGIPEADIYGPGGFELIISDHVFSSQDDLSIQVLDLDGFSLSEQVLFNTYSDCEKNLIIINFQVEKEIH